MSSPYSLEHLADIRDGARRVPTKATCRQLVAIAHPMYSLALMNSKRNEAR
jgi:hypothetical protein